MTVYQSAPRVIPPVQQNELLPSILDSENNPHLYWNALPEEVLQRILSFVYNPASFDANGLRLRLVSKRFWLSSDAFFVDQAPQYLTLLKVKNELEKLFLIVFRNFDQTYSRLPKLTDQGLVVLQTARGLPFSKFNKKFSELDPNAQEEEDPRDNAIVNTLLDMPSFNLRMGLQVAIASRDSLLAKKILEHPSLSLMRNTSVDKTITTELKAAESSTEDPEEKEKLRSSLVQYEYETQKKPYNYLLKEAVKNGTDDILKLLLDYLSKKLGGARICDKYLFHQALQIGNQAIINVLLNPQYNVKIKLYRAFDLDCLRLLIEPILTQDIHILADLYRVLEIALDYDWVGKGHEYFYDIATRQMTQLFKDPRLDLVINDYALFETIIGISPGLANLLQNLFKIDYYKKLFAPVFKGKSRAFMMHALFNHALELAACTTRKSFDKFDIKKVYRKFCEAPKDRQARREALSVESNVVDMANKTFEHPSLLLIRSASEDNAKSAQLTAAIASTDDPKEKGKLSSALAQHEYEIQNPPYNHLLKEAVKNRTDDTLKLLLDSLTEKLGDVRLGDKHLFPLALQMRHQSNVNVLLIPKYNLKINLHHAFDLDCLELLIEPILTIDIHILADLYQVLEIALENDRNSEDNEDFYETARKQIIRLFKDPRLDLEVNDYALFKTITEISPGLANLLQDLLEIDYYEKLFAPVFKGKSRTFMTHALFNHALELAACAPGKSFDEFDIKRVYRKFCKAPKDRQTRREALIAKPELAGNDRKRRKISEGL